MQQMGQEVWQDLAISLKVMHTLMVELDADWTTSQVQEKIELAGVGVYAVIFFCGSFWGHEVFLVDLFGLRKKLQELERARETNHISIPLLKQLKGEDGSQYHLTPLATCTDSGLEMKKWVSRLPEARELEGRADAVWCLAISRVR